MLELKLQRQPECIFKLFLWISELEKKLLDLKKKGLSLGKAGIQT